MTAQRRYRPTTLRIFSEACPAALEFFGQKEGGSKQGADRMDSYTMAEREIEGNEAAEIGIAFHACVHAAAEAQKHRGPNAKYPSVEIAIEATALALTKQMDPARARAGADMAVNFVQQWSFDPNLNYEHGIALRKDWKTTGWDDGDVRLRMVLDVYGVVEESSEESTSKIAISEDYKTGWGASELIVDSIQMKCHSSALLSIHGKDADFIEVRVHATRFRRVFSKRWDMHNEQDVLDLEKRRADVEFWMNAADMSDLQPRIGPGCINCDFATQCPAFQSRLETIQDGDVVNIAADPHQAAIDLAIVQKEAKRLQIGLREATKNRAITIGDMVLGFHVNKQRNLKDAAALVEFWFEKAKGSMNSADDARRSARGLLKAMKPGVTQFDNMVKLIARTLGYKSQKVAIDELSKEFCEEQEQAKFKWAKNKALNSGDESEE